MRKPLAFALAALAALAVLLPSVLPPRAARASDADPAPGASHDAVYAKQMEAKAAPLVAIKLVMKFGDNEFPSERPGVVVDASGVVMGGALGGGRNMKIASARVVFPGDEKEYDAVLGAFDTKLGLSFFRIKDLAGKTITSIDPNDGAEVVLGEELFGVARVEEGFDYKPMYGTAKIVGQVEKPRTMWLFSGTFGALAHPMYNAAGKIAGILIMQQGIAEGRSGSRQFLLPIAAAKGTIASAIKQSAKALADAQEAEKEKAEGEKPKDGEPAMGGEPAPMDGDGSGAGMDGGSAPVPAPMDGGK